MSVTGKTIGTRIGGAEETLAGDFLKTTARTPLSASFLAAGVCLRVETNSEDLLGIAAETFQSSAPTLHDLQEIRLKLWVEQGASDDDVPFGTYFRGLDHLVFCGFDERNSLLLNLQDRSGAGRFTPRVAADAHFWKTILFPSLLTIMGPSVGMTVLHCACVSWKGSGLLLAGISGAGKSTLSLALAQAGFDYLSDDRTLIRDRQGRVLAWGLSAEMKQCASAVEHFSVLRNIAPNGVWKGSDVIRFDPAELPGINRVHCCEPRWVVFLERDSAPGFFLDEISSELAIQKLGTDVHRQAEDIARRQFETIKALCGAECFTLRYGGNPHTIAGALRSFAEGNWSRGKTISTSAVDERPLAGLWAETDPLRRFRSTPLHSDFLVMSRRIRLETDSPKVLKHAAEVLGTSTSFGSKPAEFVWRIVCEPRKDPDPCWPPITALGDRSVRYINFGGRSFIAVDLEAREGVGVVAEHLAGNEAGFAGVFLSSMFYLTAPALGLVTMSAASVAADDKCLLLFGPPNSGKTTSSFWSQKLGMTFHADQATFLEPNTTQVRAWGEFWPAAFRPETVEFLPELASAAQPFHYRDRSFLCVNKGSSARPFASSRIPAACIFLNRDERPVPRLIPISGSEAKRLDLLTTPFKDDAGSSRDRERVLQALQQLPWYRLQYGEDPYVAALFFRSMLHTHHSPEELR